MTATQFTVKSNWGWGWRIVGAPECPSLASRAQAQRYADLRNAGKDHLSSWAVVEFERYAGHFGEVGSR